MMARPSPCVVMSQVRCLSRVFRPACLLWENVGAKVEAACRINFWKAGRPLHAKQADIFPGKSERKQKTDTRFKQQTNQMESVLIRADPQGKQMTNESVLLDL